MIPPARIAWPPKTLTPRRFDSESRPLRELPPAFLCALVVSCSLLRLAGDRVDAKLGVVLPVPLVLLVMLAPAHLEDLDLVVPTVRNHGGRDGDAGERGRAYANRFAADQEDLVEHDLRAHIRGQRFDLEFFSGSDPVLLAPGLDDRVRNHRTETYEKFKRGLARLTVRLDLGNAKEMVAGPTLDSASARVRKSFEL